MKIYLPSRLRAALLVAILSVSSFSFSSAHAAGVAETKEELEKTTLTELNKIDSATYPNKSAYQLDEVTDLNPAKDISIFKYLYDVDTGSYKAVQYNVVFGETLGDEMPAGADYTYYKWVGETHSYSGTNHLVLKPAKEDDAALKTYSINNSRLETNISTTAVARSFFRLTGSTGGGAIYHGLFNTQKIDISGNFIGNNANDNGGAIFSKSDMGNITGDFVANYASGRKAYGGAIANEAGIIDSIIGDFIGNSTMTYDYFSLGGGIYNSLGRITRITGDFIGNSAQSSSVNKKVLGGAIVNSDGYIGFLALDSSMQFTGNYVNVAGSASKHYEAIYNFEGTLNFNAYGSNSIVVNDGINGGDGNDKNYQIININNGHDGADEKIDAGNKLFSTVAFNSFVDNQTIIVHAGELHLGKFTGIGTVDDTNYIPSTEAELNNSSLTIKAGALVSVQGQLKLNSTSSISSSAEGETNAVSTIKGLAADSSINGSSGVSLTIADNSKMKIENITLTNIALQKGSNAELTLSGVTLGAGVTSNSALSLADSTLVLSSTGAPTPAMRKSINAGEYSYYTLNSDVLIDEVTGSFTLDITLTDTTLLGVDGLFGLLLTDADGAFVAGAFDELSSVNVIINGYNYSDRVEGWSVQDNGLFVVIPEPSTATLSLLALAGMLARRRRKAA